MYLIGQVQARIDPPSAGAAASKAEVPIPTMAEGDAASGSAADIVTADPLRRLLDADEHHGHHRAADHGYAHDHNHADAHGHGHGHAHDHNLRAAYFSRARRCVHERTGDRGPRRGPLCGLDVPRARDGDCRWTLVAAA